MAIKRTSRCQPRKSFKKYCKNKKSLTFSLVIYLGYLKFIQKLVSEARLNAHRDKARTMLPEHVKAAAKDVFLRLGQ